MEAEKKKHVIKEVVITAAFAAVGALGMVGFNHFYGFFNVSGHSMENTYFEGDKLLIERNHGDEYEYGEVVVLQCTEEGKSQKPLIKRVIAKGGDTLDIDFKNGVVTRNGEILDEPYIKEKTTLDEGGFEYPITVPDGCYFVMGDNRNNSDDSRDALIGFVPEKDINGRVKMKLPKWL